MTWQLKCDSSTCFKIIKYEDAIILKNVGKLVNGKSSREDLHFCCLEHLIAFAENYLETD